MKKKAASFPVVLGNFGCEATCQTCRENSSRIRARFQAASGNSDSANWPGYEAEKKKNHNRPRQCNELIRTRTKYLQPVQSAVKGP